MNKQSLAAQNAVTQAITIDYAPQSMVVVLATSAATNAGAVVVIEVEAFSGEWIAIGLFDAKTQAKADNVTGPSQYGWTDVPSGVQVRARRTDAVGGTCEVGFAQARA
jgi:lipocalin